MDPKLLEKLQKVLTLAKEGVEGEATAAAAILKDLLTKHNLSIADLEAKGAKPQGVTEKGHDLGKAAFRWKLDLAEATARHFFCEPIVDRHTKTVSFVGRPDNVESLTMLYAWLIQQVQMVAREERAKHMANSWVCPFCSKTLAGADAECECYGRAHKAVLRKGEHVDPLRWQVNFGVGAVQRLSTRLEEEKERQQKAVARNEMGDVVALAIRRDSENSDYLEKKYGYRTDGQRTQTEIESEKRWQEYVAQRKAREQAEIDRCRTDVEYAHRRAIEEEQARVEREKVRREDAKRERARQRRRDNYTPRYREERYNPEKERQEEQARTARNSGRVAADRINLKPFLTGHVPTDESKQVKGKKE